MATRLLVAVLALLPFVSGLGDTDTITWGGDNSRTGYQTTHNMDPSVVGSDDFAQIFKTALPGNYNGNAEQIFSQPLVYTPSNGTDQFVYFATTQNNVYKLDAATGVIVASRNLAIPFLTADLDGCVDINPCIGVSATGVVDPATDTIYYTSKTYADQQGGTAAQGRPAGRYYVHAVSAYDLSERANFPVDLEGLSARNNPERLFNGGIQHQRPALLHAGQYIYAGFASHCVQYNFTGWLIGVDKTTGSIVERFTTEGAGVPYTTPGGGIWMSGGGLASDDQGSLFFASGNGYASQLSTVPVEGRNAPTSLEEAAVHMSINDDGSTTVVDFFMPQEKQALDGADKDLGTSPLQILPSEFACGSVSRIGVVTGKSGKTYWLNLDDLGGYRTGANSGDAVLQVYQNENSVYAGAGVYPLEGGYIYINVIQYPTHVFQFSCNNGVPSFTKVADSPEKNAYTLGVSHGTVTTLDGQAGTGLLWTTDVQGSNLRIYDAVPVDGSLTLRRSFSVPGTTKFTRAVFGNGRMYMGTTLGYVYGFGGPTANPLNCSSSSSSSPHQFGSRDVVLDKDEAVTASITCTAVIATKVTALSLSSGSTDYNVSTTATLPEALAVGDKFTFSASFRPSAIGLRTGSVSIATTNGVKGYTSKTAVLLEGTGTSAGALLAVSTAELEFNDVVLSGDNATTEATQPTVLSNEGNATLTISGVLFGASASGPWTAGDNTATGVYDSGVYSLSNVPATLAAGAGQSVTVTFHPTTGGNYTVYARVVSTGGNATFALTGNAGPAATCLIEFQTTDGTGWVTYAKNRNFSFGQVTENTARTLKMRITNNGSTADAVPLSITVSKPPFGVDGSIVQANNNVDLAEGTTLKAGESATASLYCAVPKTQWNTDSYYGQANWTLNTNDPVLGKQWIQFSCEAVAEQAPPLADDGQGTYRYRGCYKENNPGRQLTTQLYSNANNTVRMCIAACAQAGYKYCATQYNVECWAGNTIPVEQVSEAECNYACGGDINEVCGGNGAGDAEGGAFMSLFATAANGTNTGGGGGDTGGNTGGGTGDSGTTVNPGVDGYASIGCYHEPTDGRALANQLNTTNQTVADCLAAALAKSYVYAGLEYGGECWAGNVLSSGANKTDTSTCTMSCNGNSSEYCGGATLLNLYRRNSSTSAGPSASASTAPSAVPTSTSVSVNPGVSGYTFLGCYHEPADSRAFAHQLSVANQTVADCIAAASAAGYVYAGLEYGGECWAGSTLSTAANKTDTAACAMACNDNATEYCGGPVLLDVYLDASSASGGHVSTGDTGGTGGTGGTNVTSPSASSAPSSAPTSAATSAATPSAASAKSTVAAVWSYLGCYTEGTSSRALAGIAQTNNNMTYEECADYCAAYAYFGVEYGDQCYCGNYFATGAGPAADESQCSTSCAGDTTELCGNGNRLNVYQQAGRQTGAPAAKTTVSGYTYLGCYSEATNARALAGPFTTSDNMTQEACATFCETTSGNYTLFGVEYATQCFCGNTLGAGSTNQTASACTMACGGDAFELCGGGNLLNVWKAGGSGSSGSSGSSKGLNKVVKASSGSVASKTSSSTLSSSTLTTSNSTFSLTSTLFTLSSSLSSSSSTSSSTLTSSSTTASTSSSSSSTSASTISASSASPSLSSNATSSPTVNSPFSPASSSAAVSLSSNATTSVSGWSSALSPTSSSSGSSGSSSSSSSALNSTYSTASSSASTAFGPVSLVVSSVTSNSSTLASTSTSASSLSSSSSSSSSASSSSSSSSSSIYPTSSVPSTLKTSISSSTLSSNSSSFSSSSSTYPTSPVSSTLKASLASFKLSSSSSSSSSSSGSSSSSSSRGSSSSPSSTYPTSSVPSTLKTSTISSTLASSSSSISSSSSSSSSTSSTSSSAQPTPSVFFNQGNTNFTLVDCYHEPSSGHLLTKLSSINATTATKMTVGRCLDACSSFQYAGLEDGKQCWCGSDLTLAGDGRGTPSMAIKKNDTVTQCATPCAGNATEYCGGLDTMLVYNSTVLV